MLFGCELIGGGDDTPDDGPGDGVIDGGDEGGDDEGGGKPILLKLPTPTVYISDRGVASWDDVYGATAYRVVINCEERFLTSTQIQLKDGDTISVCAIGNGETTKDSNYSALRIYEAKAPVTETPISDMAAAPLDQIYTVKGYVCAAGKSNLLLTDNKGNYIYVYTVDPHGYKVGDEVKFTGTKAAYWNVYELKDITSSELVSSGNEIQTPFVKEGTADYFEDKLENFTVGELVTVTGRLTVNGNYYNFEVAGLDGVLLSLAYNGTLEDGADYTVTGYLAFVSGSSAKYINVIVTDIKEINNDEPPEVCEICGVSVLFGDHSKLGCGHYACDGMDHTELDCGHYACDGMDHTELDCGHYACDGMEHHILDCGHRICDGGEHAVLGCGHFACEGGEHFSCAYCGGYLCTGDHSLCGGTEIVYCEACKKSIYEGEHLLQNCGHYTCVDGEHGMYGCGHFTCEDGDHSLLDCGHHVCQEGDHTPCEFCGIFNCVGDHSSCGIDDTEYCQRCGEDISVGAHFLQGCGHYSCVDGMHELLVCGHYSCVDGEHASCVYCGGYLCTGDHFLLECGHFACQDGNHIELTCGHYECEGGDHTLYGCGHCASMPGAHIECDKCGRYLCTGDHSSCGEPVINYCNICGKNFEIGDHYMLPCGHYACEDGEHVLCERCETYRCQGDHTECDTPSEYCELCGGSIYVGDHYELDCGHCASLDGEHSFCERCGEYLCDGLDHTLYSCGHTACEGGEHYELACGHFACEDGEHRECMTCLAYLCNGDDHSMLECGHNACHVGEHTLCEHCRNYLCFGYHEPLDCGHYSCENCERMLCPYCGEYLCNGEDHSSCGEEEVVYCEVCGNDVSVGNHEKLECGHKACAGGEHGECPECSGYLCVGEHEKLACGHRSCMGGFHSLLACGHYECKDGEHEMCVYCGGYLCTGDHSDCRIPEIEYCPSCGEDISVGDHDELDCGHYACDGIDHSLCEICEEPLCIGEHGDGVCMKLSTFPEVIEGEYGEVHIVEGIICAVSADEILITDNEGNYLYVYTEQPHGYTVGDGVRATGHLETYGNLTYELVATDIVCTSGGNDIVLPRLNSVDSSYFLDAANSGYKMGEYITFAGYLDSSTDFFVVGDIYVGVSWTDIEIYYGETYQVVAYTLFISEDSAWVIATDFHGESDSLICPICGFYKFEGDHSEYICGHYACEGGDHKPLPCGHFECDEGEHYTLSCGHYVCTAEGEHDRLDCGHYACEPGKHYAAGCGHFICLSGEHTLLECGHWSCEGGAHTHCGYCGGYLCTGDHSNCEEDEEVYCEICGGILTEGDHYLLVCGHYICDGRDHTKLPCEHYICDGEDHFELSCGHYACEEGSHVKYACGHFACRGGKHGQLPCGHYECQGGSHGTCGYCGGYLCRGTHEHEEYCGYCGGSLEYGDHSLLDCGHRACQDGDHETCGYCGEYYCHGGVHSVCYGCRGAVCDGKDHGMCPTCGWYLCRGDHSILECGHKACDGGSHYPCDVCGEYLCLGGEHTLLECGHYICDGGVHKSCTACGEYTCNAPDHSLCILCNEPECVGIHKTCPGCGEASCNMADHPICEACGNLLCVGDHTECVVEGYFSNFDYSIHVSFSVDNYFLENDEISRPLIRLISNGYHFEKSLKLKFVPSDDGTFVLTAGFDLLGLVWIDEYTFSGTFENVGLLYRIRITEASRFNASTEETEDMMQYKGTYFPFTNEDYIMVDDDAHTFGIEKYGLLFFIFSEQYDLPIYGDICYFCQQEVTDENIPIHMYVCDVCGKHYCEGGVTEHLFYNDATGKSEHYKVSDEEKRWGVKMPGDVVINPISPANLTSDSTKSEATSSDDEEE